MSAARPTARRCLVIYRLVAVLLLLLTAVVLAGCTPAEEEGESTETVEVPDSEESAPGTTEDESLPPGPTGDAAIEGRVTFAGEVPDLRPLRMEADPECAAKHPDPVPPPALVVGDSDGLANVLVRVTGGLPEGSYPAPAEAVVLDQQGCLYRPHVMGAVAGQDLKILNSDGLLHNVHSLSTANPSFNRAMPAAVTEATFELLRPEDPFRIKCDVHPWMSAFVGVMEHPFFDVSEADGSFGITGLPAGSFEIEAWHERLGTRTATVEVKEGETGQVDFVFER